MQAGNLPENPAWRRPMVGRATAEEDVHLGFLGRKVPVCLTAFLALVLASGPAAGPQLRSASKPPADSQARQARPFRRAR